MPRRGIGGQKSQIRVSQKSRAKFSENQKIKNFEKIELHFLADSDLIFRSSGTPKWCVPDAGLELLGAQGTFLGRMERV